MLTQSLQHPCARSLVQAYWANFCDIFSEEHQNQLVTIQVLDAETEENDTFDPAPLNLIGYDPFRVGNFLTISVGSQKAGSQETDSYEHIINNPKEIDIFYEHGEQIFAVMITDKNRTKTVIYFEESAVVIHGTASQLQSLLSRKSGDVLSLV